MKLLPADTWRNNAVQEELRVIAAVYNLDLSNPADLQRASEVLVENKPELLDDTPDMAKRQRRNSVTKAAIAKAEALLAKEEAEAAQREAEIAKEQELKATAAVGAWSESFREHLDAAGYPDGVDVNEHNPNVLARYRAAFDRTVKAFIPRRWPADG